jgi:copper homeostasis protein
MKIEIIGSSLEDIRAIKAGGADRVELCNAFEVGGLSGQPHHAERWKIRTEMEVAMMVRPFSGGFCYTEDQKEVIISQCQQLRNRGVAVVIGALLPNGELDLPFLRTIQMHTLGAEMVCHRCFDLVPNPLEAVDELISIGFKRILTSGQKRSAIDGADLIAKLVEKAKGRIEIMAGSGVRPENVDELIRRTGVDAVHASCWKKSTSPASTNGEINFGDTLTVDRAAVARLVEAVNSV